MTGTEETHEPATGASPVRRGYVLAGLMLTTGLAALDSTVVATAVPAVVRDLGGFTLFAWVFSVYVLATAVSTPVYSKLADSYGRRPMILIGTVLFLAGSVACGFAWSMPALIGARALQGLGAGALTTMSQTVVGDLYSVEERGRISGYMSSVWGLSAIVGPAIGGLFSQYASWRWIFFVNLPLGAAALVMVVRHLRENVRRTRHRVDVEGGVLLVVWTGALVLGLLSGGVQWPWLSVPGVAVFAVAAIALVLFVLQERRAAEPMMPAWVFRSRTIAGPAGVLLCVGLLMIGVTTFLPTFAQSVLHATPIEAGFVLAVMSIGWPIAASLSSRLYMRIGFRNTSLFGVVFLAAGAVVLVTLSASSGLWYAGLGCLFLGAGLGLLSNPMVVGVQSVVDWQRRGVVTGTMMFTRTIGNALGAAVYGGVANATLTSWFADAPDRLRGRLPASVDDATRLAGSGQAEPAVLAFVRDGLALAVHHVLVGVAAVVVLTLFVLIVTPRRLRPLASPEPAVEQELSGRGGR